MGNRHFIRKAHLIVYIPSDELSDEGGQAQTTFSLLPRGLPLLCHNAPLQGECQDDLRDTHETVEYDAATKGEAADITGHYEIQSLRRRFVLPASVNMLVFDTFRSRKS